MDHGPRASLQPLLLHVKRPQKHYEMKMWSRISTRPHHPMEFYGIIHFGEMVTASQTHERVHLTASLTSSASSASSASTTLTTTTLPSLDIEIDRHKVTDHVADVNSVSTNKTISDALSGMAGAFAKLAVGMYEVGTPRNHFH